MPGAACSRSFCVGGAVAAPNSIGAMFRTCAISFAAFTAKGICANGYGVVLMLGTVQNKRVHSSCDPVRMALTTSSTPVFGMRSDVDVSSPLVDVYSIELATLNFLA